MKTKKVKGVAKRAHGKAWNLLKYNDGFTAPAKGAKLPFEGEYVSYETASEVKAVNKWPDDEQIVKWVNRESRNTARNKAQTVAFDKAGIIKPTMDNDEQKRLQGMYKILRASGIDHAEARATCAATLKIEWADDDDSDDEETDEEEE